jgi:hypothetical protein
VHEHRPEGRLERRLGRAILLGVCRRATHVSG